MSISESQPVHQKYYDPAEVEAYVVDVTTTITTLQTRLHEALRRADEAERRDRADPGDGTDTRSGDYHPESVSLGRALLLAGEVADKTIADADARATEIIRAAEYRAAAVVEAAHDEARRVVDTAGAAAAEVFVKGEARLLAAVSAFVEGSNVLRAALTRIEDDATSWRHTGRTRQSGDRPPPENAAPEMPPPERAPDAPVARPPAPSIFEPATRPPEDGPRAAPSGPPDMPGGVHNRASRNGYRPAPEDRSVPEPPPISAPYLSFPPPAPGGPT